MATLDPLGLRNRAPASLAELDFRTYGFVEADLDRAYDMSGVDGLKGFLGADFNPAMARMTLRALLSRLAATYCGPIGWEYMHIGSRDKCNWLRERVEQLKTEPLPPAKRRHIFERLAYADMFERFLAQKFNTAKRFGL